MGRLLKLPFEMIATIFKDMAESNVLIGILKIVKDALPKGHKQYISEAVEIRRGADDDTARPQDLPETFQHDVTRYR